MPFYFEKGDLVSTKCDALVNASNVNLKMVEGVSRAIFHKAGDTLLANACKAIGHCDVGHAVMTPSFNLTSTKAIIHAVGPIYINGKHGEKKNLISAYNSVFSICEKNNFKTIAFPLLSGEFNYPLDECYLIAEKTIKDFLAKHNDYTIYMVLFKNYPNALDDETQLKLTRYIYANYKASTAEVDNSIKDNDAFINVLKAIQNKKGISDDELAFNSNVLKSDLLALYNDSHKLPTLNFVHALAIGLKASEEEFYSLTKAVGVKVNTNDLEALICLFFITNSIHDIFIINRAMFNYNLPPLGSKLF